MHAIKHTLFFLFLLPATALFAAGAPPPVPQPAPPVIDGPAPPGVLGTTPIEPRWADAPTTEWTLHKTADGAHPDGTEQQMVWLMNRARCAAATEGIWLAFVRQSNVQSALTYFQVLRDVLMAEFAARTNAPPGAFDARLYLAATNHSAYLISVDSQNHSNQFTRVTDAGFHYLSARGSVFSYTKDGVHGHAGFNVDWGGTDGTGMQTGRGHRQGLMGNYPNVGIACVPPGPTNTIGPLVCTINYCTANTSYTNHFNRFIVGTVWNDDNTNSLYDPGEGIDAVSVTPYTGTYYAVTGEAGGYAIPVGTGTYEVTFSGAALPSNIVKSVVVASNSVLLDCPLHTSPPAASVVMTADTNKFLTTTLVGQQKGYPYRLSVCTNLLIGIWIWEGALPSGYGSTLVYTNSLDSTNGPWRFLSLQGWAY